MRRSLHLRMLRRRINISGTRSTLGRLLSMCRVDWSAFIDASVNGKAIQAAKTATHPIFDISSFLGLYYVHTIRS